MSLHLIEASRKAAVIGSGPLEGSPAAATTRPQGSPGAPHRRGGPGARKAARPLPPDLPPPLLPPGDPAATPGVPWGFAAGPGRHKSGVNGGGGSCSRRPRAPLPSVAPRATQLAGWLPCGLGGILPHGLGRHPAGPVGPDRGCAVGGGEGLRKVRVDARI